MEAPVKNRLIASAVGVLVVAPLLAAQAPAQAPITPAAMAGKWMLTWDNMPDRPQQLDLTIDAAKVVTGTLYGSPIRGEFVNGHLTFAPPEIWKEWQNQVLGTEDQAAPYTSVNFATLNSNGTLTGYADSYLRGYGPIAIKRWSWKASRPTVK